jgi:hypothetical protein
MTSTTGSHADGLWAITSYFNPCGYRRRLANYRVFRERLNVPLVAIELAFGPEFELREGDAEILMQLRDGDILWQKERLLNLGLRALPDTCRKVVWLDCDVIFDRDDWPEIASQLLDRYPVIQAFNEVSELPPDWRHGDSLNGRTELTRTSVAAAKGLGVADALTRGTEGRGTYSQGHAWAARRELLDRRGLYDACILGLGTRAIVAACYGSFEVVIRNQYMDELQEASYLAWAKPFFEEVQSATGFVEGRLFHLWHGEMQNRRSRERLEGLRKFQFNPFEDIAISESGCWRWNSVKPEMHEYVRRYFASRKEDG